MNEDFRVELPGGGAPIYLQSGDELSRWENLERAYTDQYDLRKINDLTNLGTLLVQHINLYRAQTALSGRVPEIDEEDLPTGRYVSKVLKPAELKAHQENVTTASKEIREIERTMGIDKKSRDAAGDEGVRAWLQVMKDRAQRYGLHVSQRVTKYEEAWNELSWRLRLNEVGDAEDKHYEDCSDEGIIKWARLQVAELAENDREFAQDEGALIVGRA